jgi:cyclic pyranopterin phosphate synthase
MDSKAVRLKRAKVRGEATEQLDEMRLIEGVGIEGNHIQGGSKQVCLCTKQARDWMEQQTDKGLCFMRFDENILVDTPEVVKLAVGNRVAIGEGILTVTANKPCFDECTLHSTNRYCMLSESAVFLSVEVGTTIRIGDIVRVLPD